MEDIKYFADEAIKANKKNYHFNSAKFSDSCLLYHLYQEILNKIEPKNILYIHFDKVKYQVSMYFEGIINDKINKSEFGKFIFFIKRFDKIFRGKYE